MGKGVTKAVANVNDIIEDVFRGDLRHLNTQSDSEVMLNVFAHALVERRTTRPKPEDIFEAVEEVHRRCKGGYAVIALIAGVGLVGFRDPHFDVLAALQASKVLVRPRQASSGEAATPGGQPTFDVVADAAGGSGR